ncbi:hypothetical protein [Terriglobus sp.]|uniref:hypothetical protein n=1 Tax=Terriglobus sp. TaxID=1889013 RepID=UPI003AFFD163
MPELLEPGSIDRNRMAQGDLPVVETEHVDLGEVVRKVRGCAGSVECNDSTVREGLLQVLTDDSSGQ